MGVFHIFEIPHMVPNDVVRPIYSLEIHTREIHIC